MDTVGKLMFWAGIVLVLIGLGLIASLIVKRNRESREWDSRDN